MNKKLALRAAKLSSEAQKLKTSSNICIAYEHQPKDPDERKHGVLFAIIDLNGNPKQSEELIELIVDTFHGEYYQDLSRDPLQSFENSLAKINEELGDYTGSGHTHWMGKLNAVLAVFSNNNIHISQAGKAEAYLYRSDKESHITEDLAGDSVNPLRTFVNITSGELSEGDKIAIVSSGVLISCSSQELKGFVTKYQSKTAINHLADLIEGVGGSYGQNAAIIIDFLSPESLANETIDDEPDEIWLQGTTKKEMLAEQTGNVLQKIFKYLRVGALTLGEFYTNTLSPKLVAGLKFIRLKTGDLINKYANKSEAKQPVLMDTEEEIEGFQREEVPEEADNENLDTKEAEIEDTDDEKVKKPEYKSEIRIKESDEAPNKAKFVKTKNSILSNLGNFYGSAMKLADIKKTKKKLPALKKNYFLIIGVVVLLIFIPSAFLTYKSRSDAKNKKADTTKMQEVSDKMAQASSLANQSEKQKAVAILTDAKNLAQQVANSKYLSKEAKQKLTQIDAQIASITQTAAANATMLADISKVVSDPVGIYTIANSFYTIGKDGTIAKVDKKSGKVSSLQVDGKISGKVIAATPLAKIKTIEILTDKPAVYEFDASDNSISAKSASGGWENGVDMDSYGTSLYLLSKSDNQVYKHTRTSSGYAKKAAYIADSSDISNPASMKIDSDVYVLSSGGNLLKYTSGKKQDFKVDTPVSFNSADFIYTDATASQILVGSKSDKSVVVLGKDGSYKGRYTSDNFGELRYLYIEGNTVFALTKTQVLTFSIK